MNTVETLIIGAGQAGLALSRHLTEAGHDHLLLERGRIGERWRSERWESLTLLTPNWLNLLPGSAPHADPDGYLSARELVDYFERYASSFGAPVLEGVGVRSVEQSGQDFVIRTDRGSWLAGSVVLATGDCDIPAIPVSAAAAPSGVAQLHASRYRSPAQLAPGGVLVVGAGPTGQQLALELRRAGHEVTIAVGRHTRALRRYRNQDIFAWLEALGDLDRRVEKIPDLDAALRSPSLALTGSNDGEQLDLGVLHEAGVTVVGRLEGWSGRNALFADDLRQSLNDADERLQRLLTRIDALVGAPAEPLSPLDLPAGPTSVDLSSAGIETVLWATGYRRSYPWLKVPVLDAQGEIAHRRGVTAVPGLYTLGRRLQTRRSSHFIGGVGTDAAELAARIVAGCHAGRCEELPRAA
jgi:putative flavoprotein involved in K+ transport